MGILLWLVRDSNSFTHCHIPIHLPAQGLYLGIIPQNGATRGGIPKQPNTSTAAQKSAHQDYETAPFAFSQTNVDKPGYLEPPKEISCTRNTSSIEDLGLSTLNEGVVLA